MELKFENSNLIELNNNELRLIDGGHPVLGVIAGALALYEAGKAVGEFAYWATH